MLAGCCHLKAQLAGGSSPMGTHAYTWQVGAGCWWEASVPCCVGFSMQLLEGPHDLEAGSPRAIGLRE